MKIIGGTGYHAPAVGPAAAMRGVGRLIQALSVPQEGLHHPILPRHCLKHAKDASNDVSDAVECHDRLDAVFSVMLGFCSANTRLREIEITSIRWRFGSKLTIRLH